MLRFILGRQGTGKTEKIYREIYEAINNNEQGLILIVPEQFTLQAERDLIERFDLPGILGIEVMSFTRLAYRIFSEVGGITRTNINNQGKNMLLQKVLNEIESQLTIFKGASRQQGFIENASDLVSELKKNCIDNKDLENQFLQVKEDRLLLNKLKDISLIYRSFNDQLGNKYYDSEDKINMLVEKLVESKFLCGSKIWIDGFHTFTMQTFNVIKGLIKQSNQLSISLTYDTRCDYRDKDIFEINKNTFERLVKMGNEEGKSIQTIYSDIKHDKKTKELIYIEKELFAYPYNKFQDKIENINIYRGKNIFSEVESTAIKIIQLVRDKDYRWKDIAVVSNDLSNYGSIVKRTFEEYDIPYFLDKKRDVMDNPIIELILTVLLIISKGFKYEDVFGLLKSGFSPLNYNEYELLENYVLQFGIRGNAWNEDFYKNDNYNTYDIEELNVYRKKIIQPLLKFKKKIKGKKTYRKITEALYEFLLDFEVEKKLELWISELREQKLYEYVNQNTQIWNMIVAIFDQLVEILGDESVSLTEYYKVLETGFNSYEIGLIPTTIDQVLIGDFTRSRSQHLKALFVLGVNEGILPSNFDECGLFSDEERNKLIQNGMELINNNTFKSSQEKYLIYSSLSKPEEYLWMSYPIANAEGNAMQPSRLIDRMQRLFKEIKIESDILEDYRYQNNLISTPKGTFKHMIAHFRKREDMKIYNQDQSKVLWDNVYKWYFDNKEWKDKRLNIIKGLFHKNQVEDIGNEKAELLYNLPLSSSITRLEKHVKCPFSHFLEYGIRPKERKILQISLPEIGEILHNVIAEFSREIIRKDLNWRELEKDTINEIVNDIVEKVISGYRQGLFQSTNKYKYLVKRINRIAKRAIWTLTMHLKQGEFNLIASEISFGDDSSILPPIEVDLTNGRKIYIKGRIDRVDRYSNNEVSYLKIIDYKTGNKDFDFNDTYYGLSLQLLVYLEACIYYDIAKDKNTKPAGIFYFKLDDPMVESIDDGEESIQQLINNKLKLKGLILKDVEIVKAIDENIEAISSILPVRMTKKGQLMKNSSLLEENEFINLLRHTKKVIKEIGEEIINGNIKIYPHKQKNNKACDYCSYKSICQFDRSFIDNEYNSRKKLSREEVLKRIYPLEGDVNEVDK